MDTTTEWLAVAGVGAMLALVLRVVSEDRAFKRQALLDDQHYWRRRGTGPTSTSWAW